jgi:P27 family predicted phage terminase small subunit
MGSRGPIGKPPERRHGHRSHAPAATLPPMAVSEPPDPPAGLLAATKQAWERFWSSPLRALVTPADLPALQRLFCLYDEHDRAWRGYRRRRLVEGSQGQPVANPLFAMAMKLETEIRVLEDRFGCSPAARLRLAIHFGQAARTLEDLARDLEGPSELDQIRERARQRRSYYARLQVTGFADDPPPDDPRS